MLLELFEYLKEFYSPFGAFTYMTLRVVMGALTALLIALFVGRPIINKLTALKYGQEVRDDGPETHLKKQGTPTMGGILILLALGVATLLWSDLTNKYVWVALLVTFGFGLIGAYDDWQKIRYKNTAGLSAKGKLFWQSVIAMTALVFLYKTQTIPVETQLVLPFLKDVLIELGPFYLILGWFVIVGSSNAVNLTDGLDGLAIVPAMMIAGALAIFAYATGNAVFSSYLHIPYIPGVGEVAVFCAALMGAGLGFLWFNTYPAQVFMGDTGSLALGAALAIVAVSVRQELVYFVMGGIFVIEAMSVIIQVASFKLRGKRVFRMAPIHHHFELKGWPEPKVIVRFWIITVILVLIGLATLKIR